jgi:hypothetical protein
MLIPYARFLEARARRLQMLSELTPPVPERPVDTAILCTGIAGDEGARVAVRVLATGPAAGAQQS